jgi:hypothetical protein
MTPLWLTLVVATFGPVGALVGVWITQRRADRREDSSFDRELAKEQARWQREDEALTFEHRRAAYVDFFESLRKMQLAAYEHGMGLTVWDTRELPEGWQTSTFERLQQLELYASERVSFLANIAYSETWTWGHQTRLGEDDDKFYETQEVVDEATSRLLQSIRDDLKIPDKPGTSRVEIATSRAAERLGTDTKRQAIERNNE